MVRAMSVSGVKAQRYVRVRAFASGQMAVCTRATGTTTRLTTLDVCLTKQVTSMKVNGLTKKLTAMASIYTKMVPFIADSGRMTHRKVGESSVFPMVRCSLETSFRVRKRALACLGGRTATDLKVTFTRTASRVMACTDGMMAVSIWVCGRITRWKGRASKLGRLESAT